MNRPDNVAPGGSNEPGWDRGSGAGMFEQGDWAAGAGQAGDDPLNRQLAQYAFIREEDEREVRLLFRDVPANEIASAFRTAGAILISMTGERAYAPTASPSPGPDYPEAHDPATDAWAEAAQDAFAEGGAQPGRRGHAHGRARRAQRQSSRTGEATVRYFFSLQELVYTVSIASPTGVIESIARQYPSAALSEREIRDQIAVVFTGR
jgi:hypothetical protein